MSTQIFPSITPNLQISIIGKSSVEVGGFFGIKPVDLEASDAAIFIVSAQDGISPEDIEKWAIARELYIPSIVLITELSNGEVDFDDMSAIAGRMLDEVLTPYLVLHDEEGFPSALIDLETLKLSDYSDGVRVERESDPEHKVLVFEFRAEHLDKSAQFGPTGFQDALAFPAIPFVAKNSLGSFEIAALLNSLPSRS